MSQKSQNQNFGIAACAFAVTPAKDIQLFPAGEFRTKDGRPTDVSSWFIDAELAAAIIANFEVRANRTVIDFEHQTLLTAQNGQPAPASGWFSKLEWRESGLFAVDVEWTERASTMIASGEYKYISPVFAYDKETGAIKSVLNAALTNNPALDGMDAVAATQFHQLINQSDKERLSMNELLEQLRWMLNLAVTATQEEVVAELQKAIDQIKAANPAAAASADFSIMSLLLNQKEQIVALTASAANPDPSQFVSVATMKTLQHEVTALRTANLERDVNEVVVASLASGKLLPTQEDWARKHGIENLVSLKQYIDSAQPIAALTNTQTDGKPPAGDGTTTLDAGQIAICTSMGVSQEDYAKTLQAERKPKLVTI